VKFERQMKGALGMGHLSLKRLTAEGLEGGLLYWVPWVMKERLWGSGISLNWGSEHIYTTSRHDRNGCHIVYANN
jgi:hypothetical protein